MRKIHDNSEGDGARPARHAIGCYDG